MPDLSLRLNKDMLVFGGSCDRALAAQGVDVEQERELLHLIEPETISDIMRLEALAGAQCLVTSTSGIAKARLTHVDLEDQSHEIAQIALSLTRAFKPQHILAEIGSTGLPIDPSSKTSMNQSRLQYVQAARDFGMDGFDAFFLNGMTSVNDMMCALMGIRGICDVPIIASMMIDREGNVVGRRQSLEEAASVMAEYEASVVGIETSADLETCAEFVDRIKAVTNAPLLVQLKVPCVNPKQMNATSDSPYYQPELMMHAANKLREQGVQFLRATGQAVPAYTGALVAATEGLDVVAER